TPARSSCSADSAEIASGTSCTFSSTRRALTITCSRPADRAPSASWATELVEFEANKASATAFAIFCRFMGLLRVLLCARYARGLHRHGGLLLLLLRSGKLTVMLPGPTLMPFEFSDHSLISA